MVELYVRLQPPHVLNHIENLEAWQYDSAVKATTLQSAPCRQYLLVDCVRSVRCSCNPCDIECWIYLAAQAMRESCGTDLQPELAGARFKLVSRYLISESPYATQVSAFHLLYMSARHSWRPVRTRGIVQGTGRRAVVSHPLMSNP